MKYILLSFRGSEAADGDSVKSHSHRLPSLRLANGRIRYGTPPDDENPSEGNNRGFQSLQPGAPWTARGPHPPPGLHQDLGGQHQHGNRLPSHRQRRGPGQRLHLPGDELQGWQNPLPEPERGFGGDNQGERDDVSLYGTPKEEIGPGISEAKAGFMRNQLEALFQPSDNKLAMKLFGSKKALMKERIRQKAAGHWIIHPCSKFR
ncbi:ion_trans_N domain-containing protein [Caerostris extrusa]|uniref:Ion_trans_N domain-containing protein n=1 Tax=Caerostris extrusa TaxID=172846 RepID=A0AAV4RPL6_CAEEX|nr:ion_trans_N domain-containing protein [Caerostris extrusa]